MRTPGCLRIAVPPGTDAELVADDAWGLGATAVGEVPERRATLEIGFATAADAEAAAAVLRRRWPGLEATVVDAGPALRAALEAWRPHARPFSVGEGRLRVRPVWIEDGGGDGGSAAGAGAEVVVDPTLAFGYDHPSTRLCLEVVAAVARPGVAVLDVGCGSGVLAVAAAALGAGPVVAVDVDPVAVDATLAAARANGVAVVASTTAADAVEGRFDLVVANIGARTLIAAAPALARRVGEGGTLVLAGLLDDQVDAVAAAYRAAGLALESTASLEGWSAPVFRGIRARIHH